MLKDKAVLNKIVLSVIPGIAVCVTALSSVIFGAIFFVSAVVSGVLVCLLKNFLNQKTAPFVSAVISLGVIGALTMVASIFFKAELDGITHYLPLFAVTTALLLQTEESSLKVTFKASLLQGGVGALFLFLVCIFKEFFGLGSVFGFAVYTKLFSAAEFFKTPAGGLLIAAVLVIIYNLIVNFFEKRGAR